MTYAEAIAAKINKALESSDVQICNYGRRFIIRKGSRMVVDGNGMRVNGKGGYFIAGSFQAYAQ